MDADIPSYLDPLSQCSYGYSNSLGKRSTTLILQPLRGPLRRDPLFTEEFSKIIEASGVKTVKLPPSSPNLYARAERFVRTIKESCLERMFLFGEGWLRRAIHEFIGHYHYERNHQGLGNRLILKEAVGTDRNGAIQCRQRLGGMLNYYHRQAAE